MQKQHAWLGILLMACTAMASAQTPPATVNVEVEPIECYWRVGATAVRVGEPFTLVLTCSVLNTAATTVVPDLSRLDKSILQLQPFEVIDGRQAPDLHTATRRFLQYEYTLRYISEEVGKELAIPPLTLTYRVESRVQQDSAAVESRERQYILPARPLRIVSLVPPSAADIRDQPPPTFSEMESRRFRASMLRIVSWALFTLGGFVAVWAPISATRRRRGTAVATVRHASDAVILRGASRALADVASQRDTAGWTEALAARALSAIRIAASLDVLRLVSQTPADNDTPTTPGQLRVPARWPRRGDVLISGSATALTLAGERARAEASGSRRAPRLAILEAALATFATATYGRDSAVDASALDDALSNGARELNALRREHTWIALKLRGVALSVPGLRTRAWTR